MSQEIDRRQVLASMAAGVSIATLPVSRRAFAAPQVSPEIAERCTAALKATWRMRRARRAFAKYERQLPYGEPLPFNKGEWQTFQMLKNECKRAGEAVSRTALKALWSRPVSHADCDALVDVAAFLDERYAGFFDGADRQPHLEIIAYWRRKIDEESTNRAWQ